MLSILKQSGEEWEEFQQGLEEFGLSTDDLVQVLAGESGIALLIHNESEEKPLPAGLAWFEPGEELADRSFEILSQVIALQEDAKYPIRRVDMEISDQAVMQLQVPSLSVKYEERFDLGDTEGLSDEEQREAWKKAYDKVQESRVEIARYRSFMICPYGGRLLIAFGTRPLAESDIDEQSEMIASLMGKWLGCHESGEGGFVLRMGRRDRCEPDDGLWKVSLVSNSWLTSKR